MDCSKFRHSAKNKCLLNAYNVRDKLTNFDNYVNYMLCRTQEMFKYSGLPDSIPENMLELYLQTEGFVGIIKVDDNLYAVCGGLGGEPDPYYRPTILTVANPALKLSKNYVIDEECVIILNDTMLIGLLPMNFRYASSLVENDITMHLIDVNARTTSLISAPDDRTKLSGETYLKELEDGKQGILAETAFLDGIRVQPYSNYASSHITDFIEYQQYLKASWFNELGLQSNYNMKREAINSNEAQLSEDELLPLVDNMLRERRLGVERVNKMFGTEITVELNSSWLDNKVELKLEQMQLVNETAVESLGSTSEETVSAESTDDNIESDDEASRGSTLEEMVDEFEEIVESIESELEEVNLDVADAGDRDETD